MKTDIKPLLISTNDIRGGAARATFRLHQSLNARNIKSTIQVTTKESDDWRVNGLTSPIPKIKKLVYSPIETQIIKLQKSNNPTLHSSAKFSILDAKQINSSDSDLIHLNWICHNGLSIEEIARISKPVVWTLHDMWAFCGAEHYAENYRWRNGYTKKSKDSSQKGLDIDRWVWKRKKKAWVKPFQIVTPSHWLADSVRNSALMHNWPVTVIPNLLDITVFKPINKTLAREILGLPLDKHLVLFGALGGKADLRKGWGLLQSALILLSKTESNLQAVIFGQSEPRSPLQIGIPLSWVGHFHDDTSLALLYSATDVMVVPSYQEAFGQTASEAQACGCPVVAFNATGLIDIVEHKKTGYLAEPYSTEDLSVGIKWVLETPNRHTKISQAARKRAVELWSPDAVVPQYLEVYKKTIESHHSSKNT